MVHADNDRADGINLGTFRHPRSICADQTRLDARTTAKVMLCFAFLLCTGISPVFAQIVSIELRVLDGQSGQQVHPATAAETIELASGDYVFEVHASDPVARMRLQSTNSDCDIGRLPDFKNDDNPRSEADDDPSTRFLVGWFTVASHVQRCQLDIDAWYENWNWAGRLRIEVAFTAETDDGPFRITIGSGDVTEMDTNSEAGPVSAHGTRIYCPVSHFSYDDPVVFAGQSGRAHFHMFWGNTLTDASSTGANLLASGNSSCEGGRNNRSAYWTPALFSENGEPVLPESVIVYYKSFASGAEEDFNRNTIEAIPDGLEMLANQDVKNSGPWNFKIRTQVINGQNRLVLKVAFPACIQVDAGGQPVLSSADNVSHLAYPNANAANNTSIGNDCPRTHPYRIAQLSYNLRYGAQVIDTDWSLASDTSGQIQGESLHGDYIAAWDDNSMDSLVECNRRALRSCQFIGYTNGIPRTRSQLPERFLSPAGEPVYIDSTTLSPSADRTPLGVMPKSLH